MRSLNLPPFFYARHANCNEEAYSKVTTEGEVRLKEWKCVQVGHHKDVAKVIEEYQRKGWRLHTYQTAGMGAGPMAYKVEHYLLFEKEAGS